ncbi:MAG: hypothetical protein KJ941_03270, partial [Bacteroidetes bacterium]|nr:hypothetical protein [Bacteroidota bacterium]
MKIHMRNSFIFSTILFSFFYLTAEAQSFSRGLVSYASTSDFRGGELASLGQDFYYISTEFYSNDSTNFVKVSHLNKNGDTKDVFSLPTSLNLSKCKILGAHTDQQNNSVQLMVEDLSAKTSINNIFLFKINLTAKSIVENEMNLGGKSNNLTRFRVIGDSIVLYGLRDNIGLIRVSAPKQNIININIEFIDSTNTTPSLYERTSLSFSYNSTHEFIMNTSNKTLIKRQNNNQISKIVLPYISMNQRGEIACNNSKVLVASSGKLILFNMQLDSLMSLSAFYDFNEAFDLISYSTDFYFFGRTKPSEKCKILKINENLQVLMEKELSQTMFSAKLNQINSNISIVSNGAWSTAVHQDLNFKPRNPYNGEFPADLIVLFDKMENIKLPSDYFESMSAKSRQYL